MVTDTPLERILFVTGRLAEPALRRILSEWPPPAKFVPRVEVLGISVAALMHADWVLSKLPPPTDVDRVLLPGWCQGDLSRLSQQWGVPVERGPKEVTDLPEHFGRAGKPAPDLSRYDIEILAEINHAPRLSITAIVAEAERFRASGADVIDLGCIPGESWTEVGTVTRELRDRGFRVSIDSFQRDEVECAVAAGAELVLSANGSNSDWLADLGAELVVIPDDIRDIATLNASIDKLTARNVRFRIDPILEPIGFGFAASLRRYLAARERWPELPMMMGIGNLTELSEVDSAGINFVLAGLCQELRIESVLTTEVIPWCQTSVREFDLSRRLMRHAVGQGVLPKHLGGQLVMLRDTKTRELGAPFLANLAAQLKDPNFRIFAEGGRLHVMNREGYHTGTDPFQILPQLGPLDPAHAFYLGYEMAKAVTALTLGKAYTQDEPLQWGFLTRSESKRHERGERPEPPL